MTNKNWLAIILIIMTAAAVSCKKKVETADKALSVHELFTSKCTQCHSTDKPLQLHGTECTTCHEMQKVLSAHKKEALNKESLKRMKMKGAEISEEEESKILDFLNKME